MRMLAGIGVWLALTAGIAVRTASAQTATPAPAPNRSQARANHFRVSVNAGTERSSISFTGSTTTPVYAENATVNTAYTVGSGPVFDGGVLVRVAGGFHVGVAVSSFAKRQDGQVTAAIPHPFFFNTPRSISGVAGNLERRELVAHLQAAYVVSRGRFDFAMSAGPSWFRVTQEMVTGVNYIEAYPFDAPAFGATTSTAVRATKVGFNAGVDVGVRLSKNVGVGGLVRFSRTTVDLPLPGASATVKSDAGGVQAGGGLRLYF